MARAGLYCRGPLPARWLQKPVCTHLGWIAPLSLSIFRLASLVCDVFKLCVFNVKLHTSGNGVWRESMRYLGETYKQPGEPWQDWVASVMMQQQAMANLPLVTGTYESHHSVSLRAWEAFQALQVPGAPTNYWDWVELSIDCLNRPPLQMPPFPKAGQPSPPQPVATPHMAGQPAHPAATTPVAEPGEPAATTPVAGQTTPVAGQPPPTTGQPADGPPPATAQPAAVGPQEKKHKGDGQGA